ncbi:MAG: hypothetical protein N4A50_04635 [Vallitalea sp.]|nr:hypothetical protein [Vallitalea sp.]
MKRKYLIFICVCWILTLFTTTAFASSEKSINYPTRFTNINTFENTFYISSNGQASVSSYITARNVDSVKVVAILQQYNNGNWKTIKSWSETTKRTRGGAGGKWYVLSGNKYRIVSYGYTYVNGREVESTSYTSNYKVY